MPLSALPHYTLPPLVDWPIMGQNRGVFDENVSQGERFLRLLDEINRKSGFGSIKNELTLGQDDQYRGFSTANHR